MTPSSYGANMTPSSYGANMTPSSYGANMTPSSYGANMTPSSYGANMTPSSYGANMTPSSYGANMTPSSYGANMTPSSYGANMTPFSYGASSSFGGGGTHSSLLGGGGNMLSSTGVPTPGDFPALGPGRGRGTLPVRMHQQHNSIWVTRGKENWRGDSCGGEHVPAPSEQGAVGPSSPEAATGSVGEGGHVGSVRSQGVMLAP